MIEAVEQAVDTADILVLIDQEGGRVQRLLPPHWRKMPAAAAYGRWYEHDPEAARRGAFAGARLIAAELRDCAINVNCAPVLDVPGEGAHAIIGDRAYATDPEVVIALGRATAEGYLAGGVLPVIKHIPGHGRARADSHVALPVVEASARDLERIDFRPFAAVHDLPLAMTAHVVFAAFDDRRPASVSPTIMREVIRGLIGFGGLVMSDDLCMAALGGSMSERAAAVIDAGCDVALHCSGVLAEMEEVAASVPELREESAERLARALANLREPAAFDCGEALALVAPAFAYDARRTELA